MHFRGDCEDMMDWINKWTNNLARVSGNIVDIHISKRGHVILECSSTDAAKRLLRELATHTYRGVPLIAQFALDRPQKCQSVADLLKKRPTFNPSKTQSVSSQSNSPLAGSVDTRLNSPSIVLMITLPQSMDGDTDLKEMFSDQCFIKEITHVSPTIKAVRVEWKHIPHPNTTENLQLLSYNNNKQKDSIVANNQTTVF
ncbi:hypothetical protein RFI_24917 [Reticulomyxa filosa]|uniref:Uncharacterized protein n=1 Tax=Reticulomyxa filosa TaxID=46433 RepID=X6MEM7_RETFI|nr:hypothetical protein RFI_24917 [Reticulomyxa filosa]|eukprot:ETO12458.1 hypothetical protein RFI_24917 [Reticulomyxa filosa]